VITNIKVIKTYSWNKETIIKIFTLSSQNYSINLTKDYMKDYMIISNLSPNNGVVEIRRWNSQNQDLKNSRSPNSGGGLKLAEGVESW